MKKHLKSKSLWYSLLVIVLAVYYYFVLPPIHYASMSFWVWMFIASFGYTLISILTSKQSEVIFESTGGPYLLEQLKIKFGRFLKVWSALLILGGGIHLAFSPVFFSKQYADLIQVETKDFETDFPEINLEQIPLVDRETAKRLGNRHLGAISELVSQFVVSDEYTQVNIKDKPYRVSPLNYADFFRYLNNFKEGVPYYIQVNMVTGQAELVTPEKPIKYSQNEYFNRNVKRKLRLSNPFTLFGSPSFEVDDEGTPYYIATTYRRKFGLREAEPKGLITLNAMTGESKTYDLDEIPQWVDRIYSAGIIMHQLEMHGRYQGGFFNSLFSKKGVTAPSEGYNYLPVGDDIYLYTGMTSVSSEDSNVGFMLVNMRTKQTDFYPLSAAEEFSAMDSAEGSVQEKGYKATFPLLINIQGNPMYILSLKDGAGLIKQYALVDVKNYQDVYTASSVDRLLDLFMTDLDLDMKDIEDEKDFENKEGIVDEIQAVVVGGDTVYYFTVAGEIYRANISVNNELPFLKAGQMIYFESSSSGVVRKIEWTVASE